MLKRHYSDGLDTDPGYQGKLDGYSTIEVRKWMSGKQDPESVSLCYHALWLSSIESYNNPIQKGLLVAKTIHEWRAGLCYQEKYNQQGACWSKGELWRKSVINNNYRHMTHFRNEDSNCHEHFLLILLWICMRLKCPFVILFVCFFFIPLQSNIKYTDFMEWYLRILQFSS